MTRSLVFLAILKNPIRKFEEFNRGGLNNRAGNAQLILKGGVSCRGVREQTGGKVVSLDRAWNQFYTQEQTI